MHAVHLINNDKLLILIAEVVSNLLFKAVHVSPPNTPGIFNLGEP
jgi:hypothetical protein